MRTRSRSVYSSVLALVINLSIYFMTIFIIKSIQFGRGCRRHHAIISTRDNSTKRSVSNCWLHTEKCRQLPASHNEVRSTAGFTRRSVSNCRLHTTKCQQLLASHDEVTTTADFTQRGVSNCRLHTTMWQQWSTGNCWLHISTVEFQSSLYVHYA